MAGTFGGRQPGAGRPKGSKNKHLDPIRKKAIGNGMTPLEVMVDIMNRNLKSKNYDKALQAATAAAPYLHPRLQSSNVTLTNDDSKRSEEEIQREIDNLRAREALADGAGTMAQALPSKPAGVVH